MKITDLLDNPEYDEGISMLAARCMAYTMCRECGHVDDEIQTRVNHPCMTCGVNVERRMILFGSEKRIVKTIFECYQSSDSKPLCVLLFCTLVEQHIGKLIQARCRRLKIDYVIVELLMDKYWQVDARLKLFERITGTSVRAALSGHDGAKVFEAYSLLQKKRNKLAHGEPWGHLSVKTEDIHRAVNEAANSFSAMALLYHKFCASDSPPLPTP